MSIKRIIRATCDACGLVEVFESTPIARANGWSVYQPHVPHPEIGGRSTWCRNCVDEKKRAAIATLGAKT